MKYKLRKYVLLREVIVGGKELKVSEFLFLCGYQYACRKTLADNRPRIRGRFARNDESSETLKVSCSTRDEDDVDFWVNITSNFVVFSILISKNELKLVK